MDPITRRGMVTAALVGGSSLILAARQSDALGHEKRDGEGGSGTRGDSHGSAEKGGGPRDGKRARVTHHTALLLPADMSKGETALKRDAKKVEKAVVGVSATATICNDAEWLNGHIYCDGQQVGTVSRLYLLYCNDGYWSCEYKGWLASMAMYNWIFQFSFYDQYQNLLLTIQTEPVDLYNGPFSGRESGTNRSLAYYFDRIREVWPSGSGNC